jgi:hypothetical protein
LNAEALQEKLRRSVWVLSGFTLALTAVSVILFAATLYTWNVISQVRDISQKMEEIGAFEKRINSRLDLFNNGIQSQFDKTNSGVANIQVQLSKSISDNRDALTDISAAAAQLGRQINAYPPGENDAYQPAPREVRLSAPGRSLTKSGAEVPVDAGQLSFRRIIMPNGSIRYEMVR